MTAPDVTSFLARFKRWLGKLKPWAKGIAIAGAVTLNVIATIAAAISAYYSSKQTELATEAVNLQSRNEAFAELVRAMKDLCAVSMTEWDQVDFALHAYMGAEEPYEMYFVRSVNIDEVFEATKTDLNERVEKYITEGVERRGVVWDKFDILQIWLDENRRQAVAELLPPLDALTYTRGWMEGLKMPPAAVAVKNNYECRATIRNLMKVYKSDENNVPDIEPPQALILPYSEKQSTEEILTSWGDGQSLQILRENELLNWFEQSGPATKQSKR